MKYRIIAAFAVVAFAVTAGLFASACNGPSTAKASITPTDSRLVVAIAPARQRDLIRSAQTQGALFPKEKAVLAAEDEGALAEVYADMGDKVAAGQVLARIDPREYQLRLDSAQAQLEQVQARMVNAQANFQRMKELNKQHLVSAQQSDQSSSEMRVVQADASASEKMLGIARKKFGDTYIRAPFAGSVQKRMVSLGEHVGAGMPLYELIATDPIKLRAPIPERFVPMAKVGLPIDLTIDARPDQTFHGAVTRIAPALDENSRTLLIEAEVPNPDGALKPGYFAHVTMNLGHDRALFVPNSAVLRYAGIARVFVYENGAVRSREITTGSDERE